MEPCVDGCREDIIKRLNLRMTTKNFLVACAIIVGIAGTAGTIVYTAYAGGQKEVREAVKETAGTAQRTEKKVTEIEVNQRHVMEKQKGFGEKIEGMEHNQLLILQEVIKIREHQTNGP